MVAKSQKMESVGEAWLVYRRQLLSFIRARVGTVDDAEDILNDVFVKLTKSIAANAKPDNISAWLYHVTKNSIVDYYRTKKAFEALPEELTDEIAASDTIKQLSSCLLPMIRTLPETFQQALVLSEIEGKKHKDLARELGLSLPAVKSRILRGREELHKSMVRCFIIYRNNAGDLVDYAPKPGRACTDCQE